MPTSLVAAVAPRTCKFSIFLKEENICYKNGYYTLCLGSAKCQKVRIYVDEKTTFLKEACEGLQ